MKFRAFLPAMNPNSCPSSRLLSRAAILVSASLAGLSLGATLPVSFHLSTHPSAVALQFDAGFTASGISVGTPILQGAGPHLIDSQLLANGKTRFVIYSSTNTPMSASGVDVTLDLGTNSAQDGMMTITGVMASNESGASVSASPGVKPVVLNVSPPTLTKAPTGTPIPVGVEVVDPDGSITMLIYRLNGSPVGSASAPPFTTSLTSSTPGNFNFSVFYQDNAGNSGASSPVTLRYVDPTSLTSFAAFQNEWLGGSGTFSADPFGTCIPNGLAWALGMDPRNPDRSRLPSHFIDDTVGGKFLVYRARILATGPNHQVRQSTTLAANDWAAVPGAQITETPEPGGWKLVEARIPITPANPSQFVKSQVEAP